jgi:H+/Cl- antiporter ClcA
MLAGCLLAALLLKVAMQNGLGERKATSMGRWVAGTVAVFVNITLLAVSWAPLSPTGVDSIGQTNQSFMTSNTSLAFWAVVSLTTAIAFGGWAGKELRQHLYADSEMEFNESVTL